MRHNLNTTHWPQTKFSKPTALFLKAKCKCSVSHEQYCVTQGLQNLTLQIHWEKIKWQKKVEFHLKNYSIWLLTCWKQISVSIQIYLISEKPTDFQDSSWNFILCDSQQLAKLECVRYMRIYDNYGNQSSFYVTHFQVNDEFNQNLFTMYNFIYTHLWICYKSFISFPIFVSNEATTCIQ